MSFFLQIGCFLFVCLFLGKEEISLDEILVKTSAPLPSHAMELYQCQTLKVKSTFSSGDEWRRGQERTVWLYYDSGCSFPALCDQLPPDTFQHPLENLVGFPGRKALHRDGTTAMSAFPKGFILSQKPIFYLQQFSLFSLIFQLTYSI